MFTIKTTTLKIKHHNPSVSPNPNISLDGRNEAQASQAESMPTESPLSPLSKCDASSNLLYPASHNFAATAAQRQVLTELVSCVKDPLRVQWEQIWYSGIASSFKEIAHLFPGLQPTNPASLESHDISEPRLDVSSLKDADKVLFEQEERSKAISFAPIDEDDRLRRENRAKTARSQQERLALLLGLPTYEEYIADQAKEREIVSRAAVSSSSKRQVKKQARIARDKERRSLARSSLAEALEDDDEGYASAARKHEGIGLTTVAKCTLVEPFSEAVMSPEASKSGLPESSTSPGAEHRPLVVGLTKSRSNRSSANMASSEQTAAVEKEMQQNVASNVKEAAPSEDNPTAPSTSQPNQKKEKKEKAPKQPKQPKGGAAPPAPTSPALIDLRVGHILRAIAHPNADSLYVSTIAMGDTEGTEHTQVDEETGKVVRTVCSGLKGLVPLEDMQNRKIVVVANLKPVNMRSIKSAAMVLAASPKPEEGADSHAPDRVVELVQPPEGSEAGDKVYFEGWPYGEGAGPEKQLNPKKKQWEAIQPGFYTSDDLVVGFDASKSEEVNGNATGNLVVEGKGVCTVKTLKGAIVR